MLVTRGAISAATPLIDRILTRRTMAGHSKWANIKHKKTINDQKRAKVPIWAPACHVTTIAAATPVLVVFRILTPQMITTGLY